LRSHHLTLTES